MVFNVMMDDFDREGRSARLFMAAGLATSGSHGRRYWYKFYGSSPIFIMYCLEVYSSGSNRLLIIHGEGISSSLP